jgi:hypothetical protein
MISAGEAIAIEHIRALIGNGENAFSYSLVGKGCRALLRLYDARGGDLGLCGTYLAAEQARCPKCTWGRYTYHEDGQDITTYCDCKLGQDLERVETIGGRLPE